MSQRDDKAFEEAQRREVFGRKKAAKGVTRLLDYPFAEVDGRPLICDIQYVEECPDQPRPGFIFLHGGCWLFGNQKQFGPQSARLASDSHSRHP